MDGAARLPVASFDVHGEHEKAKINIGVSTLNSDRIVLSKRTQSRTSR